MSSKGDHFARRSRRRLYILLTAGLLRLVPFQVLWVLHVGPNSRSFLGGSPATHEQLEKPRLALLPPEILLVSQLRFFLQIWLYVIGVLPENPISCQLQGLVPGIMAAT